MFCSKCGTQVDTSSRFCPACGNDLSAQTGAARAGATAPIAAQPAVEDEVAIVREALKDEYELEKELGRGGMAVVFKARDKQLEREVAIKVLPFSLSFDAEFVERFQREARTAGKLEHPNVIPIYRVGRSGRVIYFVMKYIRGKSLTHVIETRGALPVAELRRVLIECARALGYAHKHGIVHRDVKPDNIMFDELGQAIVTDFGIAKAQSGAKLTGTGMSIGTPHYMSPEQARAQNLDGRSDIYSLGVVGYECLTGHKPFDGEDSFSIGYKHIMEELPIPSLEQADQREMFAIIQKMMAKKPDDRFQTAEELIAALEGGAMPVADMATMPTRAIEVVKPPARGGAPPPAIASAATTPLPRASASMGVPKDVAAARAASGGAAAPAAPPKPALKPREAPKKKSSAGLVAALVVLGLAGAGLAGYLLFLRGQPAPAVAPPVVALADTAHHDTTAASAPQPADTAAPPATSPTSKRPPERPHRESPAPPTGTATISLHIQPRGATVRVDNGPPTRNDRIKVAAGVRHELLIEAQGFQAYRESVTLRPNETKSIDANLQPAAPAAAPTAAGVDCGGSPNVFNNRTNHCYDQKPNPLSAPLVPTPATCTGANRVRQSANFVVRVSAEGQVMGTPTMLRSSGCRDFDERAQAQLQGIQFSPARLNGRPIIGWQIVPMRAG